MIISVRFLSDWHVGTGAGIPGSVDRQVVLDEDGLPFVPAKTLFGMLRDSAETVAVALQNSTGVKWTEVVIGLFGGQTEAHGSDFSTEAAQPARLCVRPARFRDALRGCLLRDSEMMRAVRFVQPGVKIQAETGRAEEDHLFFVEQVRKGAELEAVLEPVEGADFTPAEIALLVAAAQSVERMGGKRRRGGGRCHLAILDLPNPPGVANSGSDSLVESWLQWLEDHVVGGLDIKWPGSNVALTEKVPISERDTSTTTNNEQVKTGWRVVPVHVDTLSPVVIPKVPKGNLVETLGYIPGTYLIAHLFPRLSSQVKTLVDAVASGKLAVTPLYPAVHGSPTRPVPLCWAHPKEGDGLDSPDGEVFNLLVKEGQEITQNGDVQVGAQRKNYRKGWITRTQGRPGYHHGEEHLIQRMHNSVLDESQRPDEAVGGVYTYQAIKSKTRLSGEIRLHPDVAAEIEPLLKDVEGGIRLGRSKKDDYGMAELSFEAPSDDTTPVAPKTIADGHPLLVVYLHSPVLLRDSRLRPSANPERLKDVLGRMLGVTLSWMDSDALGGAHSVFCRFERLESWHRSWNLPRPSLVGLSAGSVLTLKIDGLMGQEIEEVLRKAADVQREGIGERRAEGYGRIEMNPEWLLGPVSAVQKSGGGTGKTGSDEPSDHENGELTLQEESFLESVTRVRWEEDIRRRIQKKVLVDEEFFGEELSFWRSGNRLVPSPSQWGALRAAATACAQTGDLGPLQTWVNNVGGNERRQKAWNQVKRNRVRRNRFNIIKRLYEDPNTVWAKLGYENDDTPPGNLEHFAVRTLIQEVCAFVFDRNA